MLIVDGKHTFCRLLGRTSAGGEARMRYHSMEDDCLSRSSNADVETPRKTSPLVRQNADSFPNPVNQNPNPPSTGPVWASIAQHRQQQQQQNTQIVVGRSNSKCVSDIFSPLLTALLLTRRSNLTAFAEATREITFGGLLFEPRPAIDRPFRRLEQDRTPLGIRRVARGRPRP